jgi:hypothetical protein
MFGKLDLFPLCLRQELPLRGPLKRANFNHWTLTIKSNRIYTLEERQILDIPEEGNIKFPKYCIFV